MKRICCTVISISILHSMSAQIPRSFGDISFSLPAIYSMTVYPDVAILSYTDENKNSYLMFIYQPVASSGTPQQDFLIAWNKIYGAVLKPQTNIPAAAKKKHIKGWDYYEAGTTCINQNGKSYYAWLSVHIADNKVVACGSGAPSETMFGYNKVFTNMVINSLGFAFYISTHPLARKGSIKGNNIVGVWQGLRSALFLDGSAGRAVKRIVFYDDGMFCYEMPGEGLDSIDRGGNEENRKGFWGTYIFKNDKGTVNFSTYKDEPISLSGNSLNFFNGVYEKLKSIDGVTFNGVYTSKKDRKDWWRGYEPLIKFNEDGTFEDKSALFDVDYNAALTCATQQPGKGKYICRNFSLILFYDDGRKAQIALYDFDRKSASAPQFISLGKGLLYRK